MSSAIVQKHPHDQQATLKRPSSPQNWNFPSIEIRTELKPEYAHEDFDFYVIDTHPSKDDTVKEAIIFADIVLIPVLPDYLSIVNLRSVFDYVKSCGIGGGQIAIVKNAVTDFKLSYEIENVLDEQGYVSAGRLPRNNILTRNIASGNNWDKSMRPSQREPFTSLYARVWKAYIRMLSGNFNDIWRE